jgi:hypothetical protein
LALDKHTLALISIVGSSLDVIGALYLAYDLLGGEHGPLRTLTRAVTYGALFGIGYGLALGPIFGLAAGVAHGISLALEFARASRGDSKPRFWRDTGMSAIRGLGFAVGGLYSFGAPFALTFGALSTAGQSIMYRFGVRPDTDYKPDMRLRVTRFQLLAAANRTVGYAITGYLASLAARQPEHAIAIGLRAGLAIGLVSAIFGAFIPFVEWIADQMPQRRMGVIGVRLILIGFALQSVQYWLNLFDVPIR